MLYYIIVIIIIDMSDLLSPFCVVINKQSNLIIIKFDLFLVH